MESSSQKSMENRENSINQDEGEQEDFLVGLLEQYRRGKNYGSPGKNGTATAGRSATRSPPSSAAATRSPTSSLSSSFRKEGEDKDASHDWTLGNKSAHGGASSVSSRSEIGIDEAYDVKSENFEYQTSSTQKTENRSIGIVEAWDVKLDNFEYQTSSTQKTKNQSLSIVEAWDAKSENSKDQTGSTQKTENRSIGIVGAGDVKSENSKEQTGSIEKTDNRLEPIGTYTAWDAKPDDSEDQTGSSEKTKFRLSVISPEKNSENREVGEMEETSERFDLKITLATQETYNLYCPNCNSCITRRVILKKRKRWQRESPEQPKREKLDAAAAAREPETMSEASDDEEEESDAFRWVRILISFVFGFGFLYRSEVEDKVTSTVDTVSKQQSRWFSLFSKKRREPVQPSVDEKDSSDSESEEIPPSDLNIENQGPEEFHGEREETTALPAAGSGEKPEEDTAALKGSSLSGEIGSGGVNLKASASSTHEEYDVVSAENKSFFQNRFMLLPPKLPTIFTWWKPTTAVTVRMANNDQNIVEDIADDDDADEARVVSRAESAPSKPRQKDKKTTYVWGVEILKSIVYGGLDESVKSLGVVSSAAGSGAKTLNILALGLANLVGGVTFFTHKIRDLKNENTGSSIESPEKQDQYEELLGRRENFRIHFFLAVFSYIFFGLIPPLVYAYAFHQTGIKNYTSISVFLASLVCINLLGIGKVYVRKPPKSYIKTVVYYTSIVVSSSGISYVVGDFAGKFIEKLGWFEANQEGTFSVLEGFKPMESGFLSSSGIRRIID